MTSNGDSDADSNPDRDNNTDSNSSHAQADVFHRVKVDGLVCKITSLLQLFYRNA